jgi:aryl-alcohol dehydrogenase-like predicted oxidoreductase
MPKWTRREWLGSTLGAGAAVSLGPGILNALTRLQAQDPITRVIPGTSERLSVVGLGSSATFAQVARDEDRAAIRNVLSALVERGGSVFDTAPGYGASEEVAGSVAQELGISDRLFWATKLNVARQGPADPAAARDQVETSFRRFGNPVIDLIQVHNMGDPPVQLGLLREYKQQGRIRYLGITTTFEAQYDDLIEVMRTEDIDFIGTDYAVDNLFAEETILPLAQDRGIGVLVYAPFGRTRLWNRVAGREVPDWAHEFGAHSWAQFFLKFVAAHPAVTAITPATSRPENMVDNMGAAFGELPDAAMRRRMIDLVDGLPAA